MEIVFSKVTIDGKPLEKWHTQVSGKVLRIEPFPLAKVRYAFTREISVTEDRDKRLALIRQMDLLREPLTIYVFCIPLKQYIDVEKEIHALEGKEVDMGEFPSLHIANMSQTITLNLEADHFYDVFGFSGQILIGGGRVSTGQGEVPFAITLEEMKLLALKDLGVTLEEAKGIKAKIIPMTAWGCCGRFIIAGLCLDPGRETLDDHTIMVNHCCGIDYSHGYSKEEFLPFFKKKK